MTTEARTINVGIIGLGAAGAGAVPAMLAMENVNVVAAADVNPKSLSKFQEQTGGKIYDSAEALCDDPDVDTVWIATPNLFHAPPTILAASRGKHVVVEKPMATSVEESRQMVEAADKHGVQIVCGGSRSYSAVVKEMRRVVKAGELGRLRALTTWAATDWMLRPRRPDEYDVTQAGGVAFRQAPHLVDSVRLIAGGRVRSVRAMTGAWMAPRNTAPGFFSALLEFEDGPFATLIYDAYGFFMASEFFDPNTGGPLSPGTDARVEARRQITQGSRDEAAAKEARYRPSAPAPGAPRSSYLGDLGLMVVSCEEGEIRQSQNGVYIYNKDGTQDVPLSEPRAETRPELTELYEYLVHERPILHSGAWGLATQEVCMAIMESSNQQKELRMEHQVSLPAWA